jgi:RNA-binding protein YhbY
MKTKVIAFRVTQEEYEALSFVAAEVNEKLAEYVNNALFPAKGHALNIWRKHQKRVEAKAKRDAKKAAANVA